MTRLPPIFRSPRALCGSPTPGQSGTPRRPGSSPSASHSLPAAAIPKIAWRALLVALLLLLTPFSTSHAQQPSRGPRAGYLYPAGASRGSTTQAVVGGQFLDGVTSAYVSGTGIQITIKDHTKPMSFQQLNKLRDTVKELVDRRAAANAWPRLSPASRPSTRPVFTADDAKTLTEVRDKLAGGVVRPSAPALAENIFLEITVANDAALGRHELRLQAAAGLTNPVIFYVGELPEVSEAPAKPRSQATVSVAAQEMTVKLPVVINGQILPGGVNRYKFDARKGQSLVAAATARALMPYLADAVPGWFQATLALYDAKGHELAYDDDSRVDHDPLLHFVIPADGQYVVEIKDAVFRGREDFVYRLSLGELPFVTSIFPLGGSARAQTPVDLAGWNLPQANLIADFTQPPAQRSLVGEPARPRADSSPALHELLLPEQEALIPQRLLFAADALPECVAQKPSNDTATAQAVTLPIIINGRIGMPGDANVFRFEGHAGEQIVAEVTARRLGSPLDSILELTDAVGKRLAFNDDFDDKAAGLITHQADSYLSATLPTNGPWFVHLRDVEGQGGPEFTYRLRISHPRPDYVLMAEPSSISVRAGDSATITIHAIRRDGFTGPIKVSMASSSQGFHLDNAVIAAKQDKAQFKLYAPDSSTNQPVVLHIEGHASIGPTDVTQPVIACDNMMQAFAYWHLVPTSELLAVVTGSSRSKPAPLAAGSMKLATNITAKFVADKLGLAGEKSEKFVTAYTTQRLSSFEQMREAATSTSGTPQKSLATVTDAAKAMRSVLDSNLGSDQASKAADLLGPLFGVLERDAADLLSLDVPESKVQKAMPILSAYVRTAKLKVYDDVFSGFLSRADGALKIHDLRLAAVKDLAPIIGSSAAKQWAEQPALGLQSGGGGRKTSPTTATAKSK